VSKHEKKLVQLFVSRGKVGGETPRVNRGRIPKFPFGLELKRNFGGKKEQQRQWGVSKRKISGVGRTKKKGKGGDSHGNCKGDWRRTLSKREIDDAVAKSAQNLKKEV